MARKLKAQEPLLIAAARTLGKAAGTLVNMTQILTTEPTPPESHSASKPESIKPESPKKKSLATTRQNSPTKQRHARPKKRSAKSRNASARNTIATKRGSSWKP
jgi:cytoskeletal protein RodZ